MKLQTKAFHVITFNPSDYPGLYVYRIHILQAAANGKAFTVALHDCKAATSLDEIREFLPTGLLPHPLTSSDDPVIVEAWESTEIDSIFLSLILATEAV